MNREEAVYVGGPLDGMVKTIYPIVASSMVMHGGVSHRYKLDGSVRNPNRNAKGQRVMLHQSANMHEPCKPSDAS